MAHRGGGGDSQGVAKKATAAVTCDMFLNIVRAQAKADDDALASERVGANAAQGAGADAAQGAGADAINNILSRENKTKVALALGLDMETFERRILTAIKFHRDTPGFFRIVSSNRAGDRVVLFKSAQGSEMFEVLRMHEGRVNERAYAASASLLCSKHVYHCALTTEEGGEMIGVADVASLGSHAADLEQVENTMLWHLGVLLEHACPVQVVKHVPCRTLDQPITAELLREMIQVDGDGDGEGEEDEDEEDEEDGSMISFVGDIDPFWKVIQKKANNDSLTDKAVAQCLLLGFGAWVGEGRGPGGVVLINLAGSTTLHKMVTDLKYQEVLAPHKDFVQWVKLWLEIWPPRTCRALFFRIVLPKDPAACRNSTLFKAAMDFAKVDDSSDLVKESCCNVAGPTQ